MMKQLEHRPFPQSALADSPSTFRLLWVTSLVWLSLMLLLLGLLWQTAPFQFGFLIWVGAVASGAIALLHIRRQHHRQQRVLRQLRQIAHQMLSEIDPQAEYPQPGVTLLHELATVLHQLQRAQTEQQQHLKTTRNALSDTLLALQGDHLQRIQAEKMTSLNQMAAGLAHEVNNPVNFIGGNLPLAQRYIQDLLLLIVLYQQETPYPSARLQDHIEEIELDFIQADLPKLLSSMRSGTQRIQSIVESLRTFARLDESQLKVVDLHAGLESTLIFLQHRLKAVGLNQIAIVVEKNYGELPYVECYASQLNQVFLNLLNNAIDAIDLRRTTQLGIYQPQITIQTEALDLETVMITIGDNGSGIPEAVRDRVFDPFFTTKPVGQGTGLGLAISYQIIVKQHHGNLSFDSQLGMSSEFKIQIPVCQDKLPGDLPRDRNNPSG